MKNLSKIAGFISGVSFLITILMFMMISDNPNSKNGWDNLTVGAIALVVAVVFFIINITSEKE